MTFYLIAHKVRGEAAFDIATKMEMADGPWWIIPTSGHRAYPYDVIPLIHSINIEYIASKMPPDLRDHYEVSPQSPRGDYTDRATSPSRNRVPTLEDI